MKRFEKQWSSYLGRVVPDGASLVQVQETRRAFYAGAQALFECVMSSVSDDPDVTEGDLQAMHELKAELDDFGREIVAGKA